MEVSLAVKSMGKYSNLLPAHAVLVTSLVMFLGHFGCSPG